VLAISEQAADRHAAAFLHRGLGFLATDRGDWAEARRQLDRSLALAHALANARSASRSHEGLAALAWAQGDLVSAAHSSRAALEISRSAGHAYNWARSAALLAEVLLEQGELEAAEALLVEALSAAGAQDPPAVHRILVPCIARVARLRGDVAEAIRQLSLAESVHRADGPTQERVFFLVESAVLAETDGRHSEAVRIAALLESEAASIGLVLPTLDRLRLSLLKGGRPVQ
jgi:ATP/maltotriose-dependent transcriptional regulator MalT